MGSDPVDKVKVVFGIINREMNEIFEMMEKLLDKNNTFESMNPLMDVFINDEEIVVLIDLPGVKLDDLKVYIFKKNLVVEGFKSANRFKERVVFHRMERDFFPFKRVIKLPEDINEDEVNASLRDGVLEIIIKRERGL